MTSTLAPSDDPHRLLLLQEAADQRGVSYLQTYTDVREGRLSAIRVSAGRDAFRVVSPDVGAAVDLLPENIPVLAVAGFLRLNLSAIWRLVEAGHIPSPTIRREDLRAFLVAASTSHES